jgi:nucleoside permease NupC
VHPFAQANEGLKKAMWYIHLPFLQINWRPVLWGFLLQFLFGIFVLKWEWGAKRFVDLSDAAIAFLDFTKNGTDFTYGFLSSPPNICGMEPVIAFQVRF